jgi:hypothetical protein
MFDNLREKLKGYKTIVFNIVMGAPAAILTFLDALKVVDISALFPAEWGPRVIAIMAVVGIVLRFITTGPMGAKGDAEPEPNAKAGD